MKILKEAKAIILGIIKVLSFVGRPAPMDADQPDFY